MATRANTEMAFVKAGANNCSKTAVSTTANGEITWHMDEASSLTAMGAIMRENLWTIVVMARGDQSSLTAIFMMVIGRRICNMVRENRGGNRVDPTKEAINGVRKMVMVLTFGLTRAGIRATGVTT